MSEVTIPKSKKEERPWGYWEITQWGRGYKVKLLHVNPKSKLSYQRHRHRSENWVVVSGRADVLCDEMVYNLVPGESTFIPKGSWHQLANKRTVPLEVVEVSVGNIIEEKDIERMEENGKSKKVR